MVATTARLVRAARLDDVREAGCRVVHVEGRAIALYSAEDYARGGIKVLPLVDGERIARRQIVYFCLALVPVSLALVPYSIAGRLYAWTALSGGLLFLAVGLRGLWPNAGRAWARQLFLASLLYLTVLFIVLGLDGRRVV